MRKAAIFLNQCLPLSEVFVLHQAQALQKYEPFFAACRKVSPSVETQLPECILNKTHSLREKISEALFKATGRSGILQNYIRNADIVHAHFGPTGWLASGLAKRGGKPLVVTFHGFDVLKNDVTLKKDGLLQTVYAYNREKLGERAAAFVCVSEYVKKRAVAFGFPEAKCHVIHLGIPLSEHKQEKPVRDPSSAYRLFAAGRLVPFKGHTKLIEAVTLVQKAGYNVQLDIAGDGPLREALEAQAASSITNYKFHGAMPHDRLVSLMRGSDIFCHTSMHMENGQTEALGLVVLEAQWAGLPVVAFASGGVPEAINNGETGILCPEGDARSFADAIVKLIEQPQLMNSMSDAAPDFVSSRFGNRAQTDKLESLYDSVIENFGAPI